MPAARSTLVRTLINFVDTVVPCAREIHFVNRKYKYFRNSIYHWQHEARTQMSNVVYIKTKLCTHSDIHELADGMAAGQVSQPVRAAGPAVAHITPSFEIG